MSADGLQALLELGQDEFAAVMGDRLRAFSDAIDALTDATAENLSTLTTAAETAEARCQEGLLAAELRVAGLEAEISILGDDS